MNPMPSQPQRLIGFPGRRVYSFARRGSGSIVLMALFVLLILWVGATPSLGASTKEVLEGLTLAPHERWTTGVVMGWSAVDCIPFRFTVKNDMSRSETISFRLAFDNQRHGVTGIVEFESFVLPAGNIDGPYFYGDEGYYLWNVTVPRMTSYVLLWCARLSDEAGLWPGASMHVSAKNGGSRDVPIMTKGLSPPRPPCGIIGPESVCENDPVATFSYGDDPADLEFTWSLSGPNGGIGVWTGSSIEIDSTGYPFGKYLLTLDVYKLRGGVLTKISTCYRDLLYVESPVVSIEIMS